MNRVKRAMTDEDVSEFAEAVYAAISDATLRGEVVGRVCAGNATCCPMGALLGESFPYRLPVLERTGVAYGFLTAFIRGYEATGRARGDDERFYALGETLFASQGDV